MTVILLHVCDSRGHWSVVGVFDDTGKAEAEASRAGYLKWETSEWGIQ